MKLALVVEKEDHSFLPHIKPLLAGHSVNVITREISLLKELTLNYDAVITTREDLLRRVSWKDGGTVNISNYSGSIFHRDEKPFLILDPLKDLVVDPPGVFLATRYLKKITQPQAWFPQSEFTWELADDLVKLNHLYDLAQSANLIGIDIETTKGAPHVIKCVGYCLAWFDPNGSFRTHCFVIPFTNIEFVKWVRKFNALPAPKVFQNGLFDNSYFLRFDCPVSNWLLDTLEFFHSWYSELPKALDYIALFLLRNVWYWKDDADSGDTKDLYQYNARDAWATVNSILAILSEADPHAFTNYKIKFPLCFPCLAAGFEGLRYDLKKVNPEDAESVYSQQAIKVEESLGSLRAKLGKPFFKPGSHVQVKQLLGVLGYSMDFSDKKALEKASKKHPLNRMLIDDILKYRKAKKLVSTYLGAELFGEDRLLYALLPSGTDTGRLASRKHWFNVGAQIQNFPEYAKQVVLADEGFYLAEPDFAKSEAVCLAYISGDEQLIEAATSDKDFHCINIERFFGVPYDEVWDQLAGKTKNKPLRDLSKRVNHGTAYVMGAGVLLETMGLENVVKAQQLLGLPINWSPIKVCEYLLERYHIAYPGVSRDFYEWVKSFVRQNGKLVSALDWTRICFGKPWNTPRHFKSLVAHVPQNLSVGIINRGLLKVWNEIQIPNWKDFRIKAQIHDSMPFQYRIGRLDLAIRARNLLEQQVPVTDVKGKTRIMTIPVELKAEAVCWADLKKIAA